MRCRVVTWNIHSSVGTDGRFDVHRAAEVLAALDGDIIGLQEVDWRRPAPDGRAPFEHLAEQLGMAGVEGPNLHDHRGHYGNGLLTRFPVSSVRHLSLAYGGREPRGAIDASLVGSDGGLRVLVTHLGLKYGERRKQVATLRDQVMAENGGEPVLLLGDMNEWVSRRLMRRAFTPVPFACMYTGRTFPSFFPCLPLDCIFACPRPLQWEGQVINTPAARVASDHLPLVVDVAWA